MAEIIAGLVGLAFVALTLAWVKWVPDEQRRLRGVVCLWIAMPFIEMGLFALNRQFGWY